jgi:hypothetical protein
LKGFSAALLYWLLCFAVLCLVYPIGGRMRVFHYSLSQVLGEYLLMSLVVMCVVVLVVPLLTWWCNRFVLWKCVVVRGVVTFVVLYLLAGYIATSPELISNVPISRLRGFLGGLEFLSFQFEFAPIVSIMAGIYHTWTGRSKALPPRPDGFATIGRARDERASDAQSQLSPPVDP